jgi:hypothetical protein
MPIPSLRVALMRQDEGGRNRGKPCKPSWLTPPLSTPEGAALTVLDPLPPATQAAGDAHVKEEEENNDTGEEERDEEDDENDKNEQRVCCCRCVHHWSRPLQSLGLQSSRPSASLTRTQLITRR